MTASRRRPRRQRVPPHAYFMGSAVFHYLGPAFAVLLFARVDALGVAWLRIAAAALVFAAWRRPWRALATLASPARRALLAWGAVLAVMNCCFYLAIDRLPLATVAAIEFLPVVALAALGARTPPQRRRAAARRARRVPADRRPARGRAARRRARVRQRRAVRALHRARPPRGAGERHRGHRRARRGDADRAGRRDAAGRLGRDARAAGPGRAAGGRRRRDLLVGDPVRLRPAGDGAAARAPPTRCWSRCCPPPRPSSAWWCSARCRHPPRRPGSRW